MSNVAEVLEGFGDSSVNNSTVLEAVLDDFCRRVLFRRGSLL